MAFVLHQSYYYFRSMDRSRTISLSRVALVEVTVGGRDRGGCGDRGGGGSSVLRNSRLYFGIFRRNVIKLCLCGLPNPWNKVDMRQFSSVLHPPSYGLHTEVYEPRTAVHQVSRSYWCGRPIYFLPDVAQRRVLMIYHAPTTACYSLTVW